MKAQTISTIVMTLALGAFSATAATAQHQGHYAGKGSSPATAPGKSAMSHDQMMMSNEPHHVLAMAYHQNLLSFTTALQEQTARSSSVNTDFARAAVTEMRRSFDQMTRHHQEHMQTMSAEMRTKMSGMMQQMEVHRSELNTQLTALEQEVQSATPDAKKVSALAAGVHAHMDAMSKMKHDSMGSRMKSKM